MVSYLLGEMLLSEGYLVRRLVDDLVVGHKDDHVSVLVSAGAPFHFYADVVHPAADIHMDNFSQL